MATIMVGRLPNAVVVIGAAALGGGLYYTVAIFGSGLMLGLDTLVSQGSAATTSTMPDTPWSTQLSWPMDWSPHRPDRRFRYRALCLVEANAYGNEPSPISSHP